MLARRAHRINPLSVMRLCLGPCLALGLVNSLGCAGSPRPSLTQDTNRTQTFELEVECPAVAQDCWDFFTRDVHAWWDHTFSEDPHALVLDARVGGSFYESFDGAGNGAEHARVIYAQAPLMLRLDGPLGLSGLAVHMVQELRFEPVAEDAAKTKVLLRVQLAGAVDRETVETVQGVWRHFLIERYGTYVRRSTQSQ